MNSDPIDQDNDLEIIEVEESLEEELQDDSSVCFLGHGGIS